MSMSVDEKKKEEIHIFIQTYISFTTIINIIIEKLLFSVSKHTYIHDCTNIFTFEIFLLFFFLKYLCTHVYVFCMCMFLFVPYKKLNNNQNSNSPNRRVCFNIDMDETFNSFLLMLLLLLFDNNKKEMNQIN